MIAAASEDTSGLVAAIAKCRDEVEAAGVDPGDLTPERLGDVLYAVMTALDEPRWVVMGHGTTAEAGRQVALAHPELVEALVLDSVVVDPHVDIDAVMGPIATACRADRFCRHAYGDPGRTWERAHVRLADQPMQVDVLGTMVTIDADALERAVRWVAAPAVLGPGHVPALLAEAAAGEVGPMLRSFAQTLSVAPPLCVGYVPKCDTEQRLVLGATLSAMCPSVAETDGWREGCQAWGVGVDTTAERELTGVPTLALYGAHDPFAAPDFIRDRMSRLIPDAFLVEQGNGGHNVLGTECPRDVRHDWLAGDIQTPSSRPALLVGPDRLPPMRRTR